MNTITPNYQFEGKMLDTESGLQDFGARYYSSTLGRFMSSDWNGVPAPVPYANFTNPQTLNLYAIVHDNPETFADLDGHCGPGGPVASAGGTGPVTSTTCGPTARGTDAEGDPGNSGIANASCSVYSCDNASDVASQGSQVAAQNAAKQKDKWVNPTGGKERGCDAGGCGNFGAPRKEKGVRRTTHGGADYLAKVGQKVVAVHGGKVVSIGYAYPGDSTLRSIDIRTSDGLLIGELYVAPSVAVGAEVSAGQVIGTAQDVRTRDPKVSPHVHVQIHKGSELLNPESLIPNP